MFRTGGDGGEGEGRKGAVKHILWVRLMAEAMDWGVPSGPVHELSDSGIVTSLQVRTNPETRVLEGKDGHGLEVWTPLPVLPGLVPSLPL